MRRIEEAIGGLATLFMGGVLFYQFMNVIKGKGLPPPDRKWVEPEPVDVAPFVPPGVVIGGPYIPPEQDIMEQRRLMEERLMGERELAERLRLAAEMKEKLRLAEEARLRQVELGRKMREEAVAYPDVERLRERVPVSPGWPKPVVSPYIMPEPAIYIPPEQEVMEERRILAERRMRTRELADRRRKAAELAKRLRLAEEARARAAALVLEMRAADVGYVTTKEQQRDQPISYPAPRPPPDPVEATKYVDASRRVL